MKGEKFILAHTEVGMHPTADDYARAITARLGLLPRKKGATEKMANILMQLYERTKQAQKLKKPELAVVTVEELGAFAGISRQTMYEYLGRWIDLNLIAKTSYIHNSQVVVGYKLNGNTLEGAYEKAQVAVINHLELTGKYVKELQKTIKNEKISAAQQRNITDKTLKDSSDSSE